MENYKNKTARVIVVNPDGSIILNRRPDRSKLEKNKLQMLGGKLKSNDVTRKHSAQREIEEELDLKNNVGEFLFMGAYQNGDWQTFAFILLLDEMYDKSQMPNHEEFDSIEFVKPEDILNLINEKEIAFDHPEILQIFFKITSGNSATS